MSDATTIDAGSGDDESEGAVGRAWLVVREASGTRVIDLDDGADILIGRSAEATVQLADGKASREHARVVRRGGQLELHDLGSKNGTHWNDQTVRGESRGLRSGDLLRIGAAEILVAEGAGVASRSGGARLDGELARIAVAGGKAILLRLSIAAADLAQLSPLLGSAALVEAQSDGDYACLLEDEAAARRIADEVKRLGAGAVGMARAPEEGRTAEELWRASGQVAGARRRPVVVPPPGVVVGDPSMAKVFDLVRKVAAAPTTVLVLGETGVGKEVIAEQIHAQSPRAKGPFVRLNCGSLPESLLESELFGHERGAFTGADRRKIGYIEAADGGTLFLDEIGELALPMQTRLLRVLEDRKFMRVGARDEIASDLRIVAATNRNLEADAKAGRFREDLYFRLSAFVIRVPPLRERSAEVGLLAELFLRQFARRMNVAPPKITAEASEALRRHRWPGNVRELRNAIEHAVVLADDGVLDLEHLPDGIRQSVDEPAPAGPMREALAGIEQKRIQEALDAENGNQTRAAKRLGISRRALLYKMEKYRLKS